MPGGTSYGLHDSTAYWLHRLLSSIRDLLDQDYSTYDVTPAQWNVMITLYRGEATTPKELANFIDVDTSAITRLVDRLETKKLVQRRQRASDRRSLEIHLTRTGQELTPKLIPISQRTNRALLSGISEAEGRRFDKIIRKMLDNIRVD